MSVIAVCILNSVGFILSAITAYVYGFVHHTKRTGERCVFHFSLASALMEFLVFINTLNLEKVRNFDGFRSTVHDWIHYDFILFDFVLSSFLWSLILAFHSWRSRTHKNSTDPMNSNDSDLMKKYFFICYGIPFMFYLTESFTSSNLQVLSISMVSIVILSILSSSLFYIHLWYYTNKAQDNDEEEELDLMQIKYRFLGLVLPWIIVLIIILFLLTFPASSDLHQTLLRAPTYAIGLQGFFLLFILIIFRPQVRKYFKKSCGSSPKDNSDKDMITYLAMRQNNGDFSA